MNNRLNTFSNQAAYEAALSGLAVPNISYIESTSGVVWNEGATLYSVTQTPDGVCDDEGVASGLGNYTAGQQVTITFEGSMVDYTEDADCSTCWAGSNYTYSIDVVTPEGLQYTFVQGTRDPSTYEDLTPATLTFVMPASNVTFIASRCGGENDLCTECPDAVDCGCGTPCDPCDPDGECYDEWQCNCQSDPCYDPSCEGYDPETCGESDPCSEDPCSDPSCPEYDECTCTGEGCEEEEPSEEEPEE